MNIKYLHFRDEVRKGLLNIEHVGTDLMMANPMTKSLAVVVFKKHNYNMSMRETFDLLMSGSKTLTCSSSLSYCYVSLN